MFSLHENPRFGLPPKEKLLPMVDNFMEKKSQDNKKGGRPPKTSVSRKNKTVGVCFSEPELYAIKHRAKQAGLPLSIYCHDAILKAEIKEAMKKEDIQTLKGLANMGNNLNQFVKMARFTNLKTLEEESLKLFEEIQQIIKQLSHDWKNSKRKEL
ncbi:hypothetical protein [Dysgonomonas sp. HDW5A]|uniref:plasmid mobilization protein n=1 Tax=Dysgonomonas sp. HDW5A TaxID=2714926 RepID=UPI00210327EE|nr:hypothetical protein [Dysgonomonas sp. HDW5A]